MRLLPAFLLLAILHVTTALRASEMMQICLGGYDDRFTTHLPKLMKQANEYLPDFKRNGVTSHETYVRWNMIEPEPGKFDFTFFDTLLDQRSQHGIGWVPFLIAGSAYTLPDWFYKTQKNAGYVCLEHGKESDIESLWNPELRPLVERVVTAFGRHYADREDVESVLLGVTGNYGESIYPASELDWTQDHHGPYHTHKGWWVGDEHAKKSFQKYLGERYTSIKELNTDLGTTITGMDRVSPRLLHDWPTTAARQHQAEWALESMTEWSDFWMKTAKAAMPETDIYLITGGHAPSYHGLDISAQTAAAAASKCGVRITNEVDDFAFNFALTRMVSTSSRHYGTFFSYEPAGLVTWRGVAARIFNASSSGARCLHYYADNILGDDERRERWKMNRRYAKQREPIVDVAVYYPRRWMNLQEDEALVNMYQEWAGIRNATDFDFLDERLLNELASGKPSPLPKYKHLLVRKDFLIDDQSRTAVDAYTKKHSPQITYYSRTRREEPDAEATLRELSRKLHPEDDFTTAVFFSKSKDGKTLFLNQRSRKIDLSKTHPRMVKEAKEVEAYSLAEL